MEKELVHYQHENELLIKLTQTIELESVLGLLRIELMSIPHFDGFALYLIEEETNSLVCVLVRLPEDLKTIENMYLNYRLPLNRPDANVKALEDKKTIFIDKSNFNEYPGTTVQRYQYWQMKSSIIMPLVSAGHVMGTIQVFSQKKILEGRSHEHLEYCMGLFVSTLKVSIDVWEINKKKDTVEEAFQDYNDFLRFIVQINGLTLKDKIFDIISDEFIKRFRMNHVSIMICENEKLVCKRNTVSSPRFMDVKESWDLYFRDVTFELDATDGGVPKCFLQNTTIYFPDVSQTTSLPMPDKDRGAITRLVQPKNFALIPIRNKDIRIGVLLLAAMEEQVPLGDEDLRLMELLCKFIGTAIANAELYTLVDKQKKEIQELNNQLLGKVSDLTIIAGRDELTGLDNFRSMQDHLKKRCAEYARQSDKVGDLAICVIDIDHFKKFNDTWGHENGNNVLREVAQRLKHLAREMDLVCRYGGEEFVVILPKCDAQGALHIAKRLRSAVHSRPVELTHQGAIREETVTISIGCTVYSTGEQPEEMFKRADRALYAAKDAGRNCEMIELPGENMGTEYVGTAEEREGEYDEEEVMENLSKFAAIQEGIDPLLEDDTDEISAESAIEDSPPLTRH